MSKRCLEMKVVAWDSWLCSGASLQTLVAACIWVEEWGEYDQFTISSILTSQSFFSNLEKAF